MPEPEKVFKNGACEASIFVNQANRNGTPVSVKKVVFHRLYKDKEGKWQRTSSLDINDIPKAIAVLAKAYDHLTSRKDRESDFIP